jgi:type I restriction enzyme, S subunit
MNAERLLTHYERIADAPEAIPRLRGFILDLAVRGKLVPQDARDEPASEMLKRIAKEKARLVKAGEIKALKVSEPIRDDELPIELPGNWAWARLCDIGKLSGGMTPSMNRSDFWEGDIVWLSPKDIKSDEVADSELKISPIGLAETRLELYQPGCLFMVARSGILKRTFPVSINRVPAAANQDMKVLAPFLDGQERYLQIMFRGLTDFLLRELVKTGTTVQSLKYAEFEQQPFPLPPLAEQNRIVAKVDELMALCDRLEAARGSREAVRDRLAAASLARLNAPDPETFQSDARFVLDALPALTTRPDQIKQLRLTILNLAVRGKLVPQDAKDKVSRFPPLRQFAAASGMDNEVFEQFRGSMVLPSSWQIAPLAQLSENIVDCLHTTPKWTDDGEICIRTNQLRPRFLDLSEPRYVSPEAYLERIERLEPRACDILYGREGGILGVACRVPKGIRLCLGQRLMLIRAGDENRPDYLEIVLNSPFITDIARARTTGGAAPRVNMSTVRAYPIPLPPLAEQHRHRRQGRCADGALRPAGSEPHRHHPPPPARRAARRSAGAGRGSRT